MKKLVALIGGVGALALSACTSEVMDGSETVSSENAPLVTTVTVTNDWGGVYCAHIYVRNDLSVPANTWNAMIDLKGSTIQWINGAPNMWGGSPSGLSGTINVTPMSYNAYLSPGQVMDIGFCADAPNSSARPAVVAYNTGSTQYAACSSNSGLNPTRAALAVAMATELGRWSPDTDLKITTYGWDSKVELSSTGLSRCTNGCPNTKALLGQQDSAVTGYSGYNSSNQPVFDATNYKEDLKASFNRQYNKIDDLKRNNPWLLPPAHKLTLVGGPMSLGGGACGPHYVYKATDLNGNPLSSSAASNLANALCFYGQGSCGQNPYIGFVTTSQGCPSGQTCVAIDPTDGDTGSTSTTSAGSAPTYPLNRAWDPYNTLLGSTCIRTNGVMGHMTSRCSTTPSTCGYLYCL